MVLDWLNLERGVDTERRLISGPYGRCVRGGGAWYLHWRQRFAAAAVAVGGAFAGFAFVALVLLLPRLLIALEDALEEGACGSPSPSLSSVWGDSSLTLLVLFLLVFDDLACACCFALVSNLSST